MSKEKREIESKREWVREKKREGWVTLKNGEPEKKKKKDK